MLMSSRSWCPGPAKIVFAKRFRMLRVGLVEIAEQAPALVEIDPIGLDLHRALADLAFVRRGTATAEIFPLIAVARCDAGHALGLEVVLRKLGLDFRDQ